MTDVVYRLEQAIKNNTSPQLLLYEFLDSKTTYANVLNDQMAKNKAVLRIITSPAGRAWIKANLDGFLNYLALLERQL